MRRERHRAWMAVQPPEVSDVSRWHRLPRARSACRPVRDEQADAAVRAGEHPTRGSTRAPPAHVSQFLWQDTPFGAERVDRQMQTALAGVDYLTGQAEWLAVQNGGTPAGVVRSFER